MSSGAILYIDTIKCSQCDKQGRPGDSVFTLIGSESDIKVECVCGNVFNPESVKDQMILSENVFVRLSAASNHLQHGQLTIIPGHVSEILFEKPFDLVYKVYFTRNNNTPIIVKEIDLRNDRMVVLSSIPQGGNYSNNVAKISWLAYGLAEIDKLPTWFVHFYSSIIQTEKGFYKSALLDYAVAFETFVENFLVTHLTDKYGSTVAEYLLKKSWRIDERCKDLLELATGHKLTERIELYNPWDQNVRKPRNDLSHGKNLKIAKSDAELAHQATYQAIKWIESL